MFCLPIPLWGPSSLEGEDKWRTAICPMGRTHRVRWLLTEISCDVKCKRVTCALKRP